MFTPWISFIAPHCSDKAVVAIAALASFEYRRITQAHKDHRQKALDIVLKSLAARIADLLWAFCRVEPCYKVCALLDSATVLRNRDPMAIPDYQTLMLPVLRMSALGEIRIGEVVEKLVIEFQLSLEDRSQLLPSGRQTIFANRVHWAKSYLGKAGLIEPTRRAHFRITERGSKVLGTMPERIDNRFLRQFPEFRAFVGASGDSAGSGLPDAVAAPSSSLTPDEVMRSAAGQLEAALASDLLQRVSSGTPAFFESLVVRLLISMGYGGSVHDLDQALVGKSGDGGVDGVIDQDPLGLDRIYVQAKRYAADNTVGAPAIRDFFGSLDRFKASKGLFVTTSSFSPSAKDTANMLSKRIVLIDGLHLSRLMIRHNVGCRVEETLTIKKLDEDFFEG